MIFYVVCLFVCLFISGAVLRTLPVQAIGESSTMTRDLCVELVSPGGDETVIVDIQFIGNDYLTLSKESTQFH